MTTFQSLHNDIFVTISSFFDNFNFCEFLVASQKSKKIIYSLLESNLINFHFQIKTSNLVKNSTNHLLHKITDLYYNQSFPLMHFTNLTKIRIGNIGANLEHNLILSDKIISIEMDEKTCLPLEIISSIINYLPRNLTHLNIQRQPGLSIKINSFDYFPQSLTYFSFDNFFGYTDDFKIQLQEKFKLTLDFLPVPDLFLLKLLPTTLIHLELPIAFGYIDIDFNNYIKNTYKVDFSHFTNLKKLYINSLFNMKVQAWPPSLEYLFFKNCELYSEYCKFNDIDSIMNLPQTIKNKSEIIAFLLNN